MLVSAALATCTLSISWKIRRIVLLLFSFALFTDTKVCHADELYLQDAQKPSFLQRLQVPHSEDPWEIDAIFDGHRVKLALPDDLDKVDSLPLRIKTSVRKRIEYRARNIKVLREAAESLDRILSRTKTTHLPSHAQTLERIVISLPPPLKKDIQVSPLALHEPLLAVLPNYSDVELFLPENLVQKVALRLRKIGMQEKVRLYGVHEYEFVEDGIPIRHHTTRWIRDLLWTVESEDGRTYLILPLAFYQINDLSRPDNDYVNQLEDSQNEIVHIPLFFKGGNTLVGEIGDKRILFIGQDELKLNQDFFYNAFFYFPPNEAVLDLLKKLAGADDVRVLPNSNNLFHVDMVISMLDTGKAAMIEPIDFHALTKDDRHVIHEVRKVLAEYGFKIIDVPTIAEWVRTFKSPVNILPFTNSNNNKLSAIIPRFNDQVITSGGKTYLLQDKIKQSYSEAGVVPIFVRSLFYKYGGNFHCAVLPLK